MSAEQHEHDRADAPKSDARVLMAAERTLLAWIRTGVALMGFGFVVERFGLFLRELAAANGRAVEHHFPASPVVGTVLILLGAVTTAVATVQHVRFVRRYRRGDDIEPEVVSLPAILATCLVVAGIGLAIYLLLV